MLQVWDSLYVICEVTLSERAIENALLNDSVGFRKTGQVGVNPSGLSLAREGNMECAHREDSH